MIANARIDLITQLLQQALSPQHLEISDESHLHANHAGAKSSGGGHFKVAVVASSFGNKSKVERHKMIYMALGNAMGTEIHAISISAKTPAEAANTSLE